jgi:hypothetical protein
MLLGIASRCSAFEGAEWFDVENTLSSKKHVVAVAPSGGVLCTCMHILSVGMLCRHIVACLPRVRVIAAASGGTHSSADDSANAVLAGAGAAALARPKQVSPEIADCVLRSTHSRWLRTTGAGTAGISESAQQGEGGQPLLVSTMISLAAQQYAGRAAPADGDEAAANSCLAAKASEAVLKNRNWCTVKRYGDVQQSMNPKVAAEMLARHLTEAQNILEGLVLDPPKKQKKRKNTVGQQQVVK